MALTFNMEHIKTDLEKILDKFNESVTHSAPKKLNFESMNSSWNEPDIVSKKRRLSNGTVEMRPEIDNLSMSGSSSLTTNTSTSAPPPSPWEIRRWKSDLIDARTTIIALQTEIDRLLKLHKESEMLSENKISELKRQCEYSAKKVIDVEQHLEQVRKREHAAKQELLKTQKELADRKLIFEQTLQKLEREKRDIEDTASEMQNSLSNELGEFRRHTERIEMELDLANEDLATLKSQLEEYKVRAGEYDQLKETYDKEHHELETAISRIKDLEFEISSYTNWNEITKNSQERLSSLPHMAKELERLKKKNKELHELLGNNLLLEEQVHDLKVRLENEEGAKNEVVALQVKLTHVEQELKEWVIVAQDHCLPNMVVSPIALRSRIEQLLQNDIILADQTSANLSKSKYSQSELQEYKQKCEVYAKNIEQLNIALKHHKNFKERLQKKLMLVSKERDCFKQLLENYEKDLTISNLSTIDVTNNNEMQLRQRVDMLEKTLNGYKEMCATYEKDLNAKQQPVEEEALENGLCSVKKELDTLRFENERLRRRKEELELELEHRCLKGDFNIAKYKVVHMKQNPAAEAYESCNNTNLIEKLQAQVERLKRRCQKLEEENEMTQARSNGNEGDTTNITMNIKEINNLRAELESANMKMKKMKDCYKAVNMEFREVCYRLLGYRIDRVGVNTNYKLSSMYAESPDDYLSFCFNESNALVMVETPYSVTLKPLIDQYLVTCKSLPAFLSSLTMELFQRSTVTMS